MDFSRMTLELDPDLDNGDEILKILTDKLPLSLTEKVGNSLTLNVESDSAIDQASFEEKLSEFLKEVDKSIDVSKITIVTASSRRCRFDRVRGIMICS